MLVFVGMIQTLVTSQGVKKRLPEDATYLKIRQPRP